MNEYDDKNDIICFYHLSIILKFLASSFLSFASFKVDASSMSLMIHSSDRSMSHSIYLCSSCSPRNVTIAFEKMPTA